jgi:hypothetical protein
MNTHLPSLALPLVLAACAVPPASQAPEPATRIARAVGSPLTDLNLLREKIPTVLVEAQKNPYLPPAEPDCTALLDDIAGLDDALGPDLDVPRFPASPSLLERGKHAAGEAAFDALKGAAEGLVPYRHWVRKLSGAERHSKDVAAAISAGIVRRAFLKGIAHRHGCQAAASPARNDAPQ